ncbi:hypothetical protein DFH06DRAFT_1314184 [Mycena polygramma]|nr:hypothetical protein DFH06DRAFT_1314184 [Mycena polygramma]
MFKNLVASVALMAAVLATTANAEGCYNGGNSNAAACYNNFSEDFCDAAIVGTRSECHVLDSGTHCDFSVSGPAANPYYADCVTAMAKLNQWCPDVGGLWTISGYQYKLDPNDGGTC